MKLITDRTKSDVLLGTEKGRYSVSDLNRVETAVAELSEIAKKLGVNKQFEVKTDWDLPESFSAAAWPTKKQMTRYLDNVRSLCEAVELVAKLPATMEHLTWDGANQIEEALSLVYERIQRILATFRYSGEFFAGEENYL